MNDSDVLHLNEYAPSEEGEIFDKLILNTAEAAKLLGLSQKTIRKLALEDEIPSTKFGNQFRFLTSELISLFKKGDK